MKPKILYALKHAKKGFPVLRTRDNGKEANVPLGCYAATTDLEKIKEWWKQNPKGNIAIATGAISGIFVLDEDIRHGEDGAITKDGAIATAIIQKITGLFNTRTYETAGGGKHYLFKLPKNGIGCMIGVFDGVDIKGEGGYIMAEGSIINGKGYKLINDADIKEAPPLLLTFIKYGAKILPPVGLTEGGRNNALFTYFCTLRSLGVDQALAYEIGTRANQTFMPPCSEAELIQPLESAYSYENTHPAPLPKGDVLGIINEINKDYAVISLGGKFSIMKFYKDYRTGLLAFDFMTISDFQNFLRNKQVSTANGKSKVAPVWLDHPDRREYSGLTFAPDGKAPADLFNMWQGYGVEPVEGDCKLFLDFLFVVICSKDAVLYEYLIHWLGNALQNPQSRPGTALVLHGDKGVGKSFFANSIGKLFGRHYTHLSGLYQLLGNFNAHLRDKCFIFVDEVMWDSKSKRDEGILKDRITGETFLMEPKGVDARELPNYMQFVLASNLVNMVPVSFDERRYVMFQVSDIHKQDTEYFKTLTEFMENGGYPALLHYLLSMNTTKIDLRVIPQTKLLQQMKLQQMNTVQAYWHNCLLNGFIINKKEGWPEKIPFEKLCLHYRNTAMVNNADSQRTIVTELSLELRKMLPPEFKNKKTHKNGKQINYYYLPSLQKCRAHFSKIMQLDSLSDEN